MHGIYFNYQSNLKLHYIIAHPSLSLISKNKTKPLKGFDILVCVSVKIPSYISILVILMSTTREGTTLVSICMFYRAWFSVCKDTILYQYTSYPNVNYKTRNQICLYLPVLQGLVFSVVSS